MKVLKLSVSCILFFTLFAGAQVVDVVLQNGDDYTGCEDSYIYSRSSSSNYGTSETLSMLYERCSSWSGTVYYHARVAIKFNLATIPNTAIIKEATLSLYAYDRNTGTQYLNNGPKKLYQFTGSWTESGIKYSNAPNTSSTALATSNNSKLKVWEDYDITSYVKGVVEDEEANNGFLLRHSSSSYGVKYRSSDYTDMEFRPKLAVSYEVVDDEPPVVAVTSPNGGEELIEGAVEIITWTAQDNVAVVSCKVSYCTDGRPNWIVLKEINGNPGTFSWTIPNTFSEKCKIKVEASDAAGNIGADESDVVFAIDPMTGINSNISKISPNQIYTVTVTNVQGREIATFKTNNPNNLTKNLPSGLNIVQIRSADKKLTKKTYLIK